MANKVQVQEGNNETLKGYGSLVSFPAIEPTGGDENFSFWDAVSKLEIPGGKVSVGFLTPKKRANTFQQMERHLQTPEMLVALKGDVVVPMALANHPGKDKPEADKVAAFKIKQGTAVIMNTGVWHWVPYPIEVEEASLLVIFRQETPSTDLVVEALPEPFSF